MVDVGAFVGLAAFALSCIAALVALGGRSARAEQTIETHAQALTRIEAQLKIDVSRLDARDAEHSSQLLVARTERAHTIDWAADIKRELLALREDMSTLSSAVSALKYRVQGTTAKNAKESG